MRGSPKIGKQLAVASTLLALALLPAVAQETGSAGMTDSAEDARPAERRSPDSFSVADIPREADQARAKIQELVRAARPDEEVQKLSDALDALEVELSDLVVQSQSDPPETAGLRRLLRMEAEWERLRARLESWHQVLQAKTSTQQVGLDALDEIGEMWRATRDEVSDDETAAAVMDRVSGTLDLVTAARNETGGHLAQLLELENLVLDNLGEVRESLARIAEAEERARGALIVPDQPPLWRIFSESQGRPLTRDVSDALAEVGTELSRFLRDNTARVAMHGLLFAGLLVLLVRRRRGSRQRSGQESVFEQASRVLGKPVSAALLVAVLPTRWIYGKPPELILETALLLALIPLMRVLPALIPNRLRGSLYALGVLLAIGSVESLVTEQTLLARLLQLGFIAAGLAGLFWMLRAGGPLADPDGGWPWRTSRRVAWVAAGLLTIALVANVAGSVVLADLITEAAFLSAYVGVVFLAAYFVLDVLTGVGLERAKTRSIRTADAHSETIRRWVRRLLRAGFMIWWVYATLGLFQLRDPVLGTLGKLLGKTLTVGNVSLSIGTVLTFLLTVWISVILARIIQAVLEQDVLARVRLPRGVPGTISTMARYAVITVGLLAAASAAGIELSQFAIIAGALGVGIGFGLQNLVNNFVSGLILVFERPIHTGDMVETGTVRGTVSRIGIRSSVLRTVEGAEVIVPNGNLISSEVTNWTLSDRMRRMTVAVGVEYGTDLRQVNQVLLEAVRRHDRVATHPGPVSLFVGFGASSLDFEVRFWTSHYDDWWIIQSEVAVNVSESLAEAGIGIPFPQRVLHVRKIAGDPKAKAQ